MATTTTRLLTAEEFFQWCNRPENRDRHFELERGKVVEVSRPGERHGTVCINVGWVLSGYIRRRGQGRACSNDTGIIWEHNPDTVRGPDLIFFAESRRFDELNPKYPEDTPQLAVEVVSPNDRPSQVTRRAAQFLRWGVPLVWVIDPEDHTVTVYRPDKPPEVLEGAQEITGDGILPAFRCPVAEFFFSAEPPSAPPPSP
jgi:Uma2 family endonuclease